MGRAGQVCVNGEPFRYEEVLTSVAGIWIGIRGYIYNVRPASHRFIYISISPVCSCDRHPNRQTGEACSNSEEASYRTILYQFSQSPAPLPSFLPSIHPSSSAPFVSARAPPWFSGRLRDARDEKCHRLHTT